MYCSYSLQCILWSFNSFWLIATVMNKSDDEIEVLATDVIEDAKPRRSSATKKVKKQEGVCMPERERSKIVYQFRYMYIHVAWYSIGPLHLLLSFYLIKNIKHFIQCIESQVIAEVFDIYKINQEIRQFYIFHIQICWTFLSSITHL